MRLWRQILKIGCFLQMIFQQKGLILNHHQVQSSTLSIRAMGKDGKMHFINTYLNMNRLRVKKVIATIVCVTILLSACNGGISSPNSSTKEEPNMESLHALYYDRLIQAAEEAFRGTGGRP